MRLLIIRHGESEADLIDVHEGRADFPLTPNGHSQAKKMSEWVRANYTVDKIYCSPLKRAHQTAEYLSTAFGLPINVEDKLMEFNNGLLAGMNHAEAKAKYPRVKNLPIHASVYEQESILEFRYRAEHILSKIISENDANATVAIVSHGGAINELYLSFLKLPADSDLFFATGDTGIHEWRISHDSRGIIFSNSTRHLL